MLDDRPVLSGATSMTAPEFAQMLRGEIGQDEAEEFIRHAVKGIGPSLIGPIESLQTRMISGVHQLRWLSDVALELATPETPQPKRSLSAELASTLQAP